MYQYDLIDKEFLADRSAEFRGRSPAVSPAS